MVVIVAHEPAGSEVEYFEGAVLTGAEEPLVVFLESELNYVLGVALVGIFAVVRNQIKNFDVGVAGNPHVLPVGADLQSIDLRILDLDAPPADPAVDVPELDTVVIPPRGQD